MYLNPDDDPYGGYYNPNGDPLEAQIPPPVAAPAVDPVQWGARNPPHNVEGGWQTPQGFVPANGGNQAGYQDLSYWASRGTAPDEIFDPATGQLRPGYTRTGSGYERTGTTPITPTTRTDLPDNLPLTDVRRTDFGGGFGGGSYGSFDPSGFQWPQFNGRRFQGPDKPFEFEAFKFDPSKIYDDPSFKIRRDEGMQGIEHGAAARGLTRLPQTLKALAGWNQDFASREVGSLFDRESGIWSMNRNNAADNYSRNYGISRDVFDRNDSVDRYEFDVNQFQPAKMTFDDLYRRWKSELDSTTQIATAGNDW